MINKYKCLAIIPARGGSKRLKRKNIKIFNGKPLIAWSILEAKKSKFIDDIVVSTEDQEIADISIKYGASVPYLRPDYLSEDHIGATEPVLDVLQRFNNMDQVVLLQPTSPLRLYLDIDECIKMSVSNNGISCVSISELFYDPSVLVLKNNNSTISKYKNSNPIYRINGAVYTASTKNLKKDKTFINANTLGYNMPINRSVDIDTINDFNIAEDLFKKNILSNVN